MRFREALQSGRVLLMDGAMGTELRRLGLREGECGELWNLTRPEKVLAVHQAYRRAGAECLLTNTFQSNPLALARYRQEDYLEEINRAALRLAHKAAGPDGQVVADVGPLFDPDLGEEFADLRLFGYVLSTLEGADALLLETCSSPQALRAVLYAFHRVGEVGDVPLLLSLTYRRSPTGELTTWSGHAPETYARHAERHGVAALGVNCGRDMGLKDILDVLHRYREETDLPLLARPNAGTPVRDAEGWTYPLTPETLAAFLPELLRSGARMVGGCCGTTPAHVAALQRELEEPNTSHG